MLSPRGRSRRPSTRRAATSAAPEASLELSLLDVARYRPLVETSAVCRQEFDTAVQRLRSDEAALQSARENPAL